MQTALTAEQFREKVREVIKVKFSELVRNVKLGPGSLAAVAARVGVTRQALSDYAKGSVPQGDVLLAALLYWDWVIRVEDKGGKPSWCEFSISDIDGGVKQRKREPVQLSLFDALTDLDQNIDSLKKSVGRVEAEMDLAFGKRA
jgi:transcriptional regulator with XRE-family HTH domain